MNTNYINIHTHCLTQALDTTAVYNKIIYPSSIENKDIKFDPLSTIYSAGIHPWYPTDNDYELLYYYAKNTNCIAIGECGLDGNIPATMALQEKIFVQQIHIAKELHKPLIIHAVKKVPEVIHLLQKYKFQLPVLFHKANYSIPLMQYIQKNGSNYYFSLGIELNNASTLSKLESIPISQLFLETDDKNTTIQHLYATYSVLTSIAIPSLLQQFNTNFNLFRS